MVGAVPPLEDHTDHRPDFCAHPPRGSSVLEVRIVSFEQPRYTCGPVEQPTESWTEMLVLVDPKHARLQPTAKTGCIFGGMMPLESDSLAAWPHVELRVDGVGRTVPYAGTQWEVCGLTPGHHAIEMQTNRGPLRCEGVVHAKETLKLAATAYGAILHIEPTRILAGRRRDLEPLTVEYDELSSDFAAYHSRFDGFPPSAPLLVWQAADGVLRAASCLHPDEILRAAMAPPPPDAPPAASRPRAPASSGCAHCAVGGRDPSAITSVALVVLVAAAATRRRRRRSN